MTVGAAVHIVVGAALQAAVYATVGPVAETAVEAVVGTVVGTAVGAAIESALQFSEERESHYFALTSPGDIRASALLGDISS